MTAIKRILVKALPMMAIAMASTVSFAQTQTPSGPPYGPGYGMMGGGYGPGPGYGVMMGGGYGPGGMMGGYGPGYGMMRGNGMMGGFGPGFGMMVGFAQALDLTPEQQKQIYRIQDDVRRSNWALMGAMMDAQSHLRDLYSAAQPDRKAIDEAYQSIGKLQQQMYQNGVAAQHKMDGVLTKEQQERLQGFWRRGPAPAPVPAPTK